MMEWALLPLKRYAVFSGRSRRKEYWLFNLLMLMIMLTLVLLSGSGAIFSDPTPAQMGTSYLLVWLLMLLILIPSIAVQVRRFHDQDKSGWFVLLNFIPYIGSLIVLVFMCLDGTRGPNRFGPDPKQSDDKAGAY